MNVDLQASDPQGWADWLLAPPWLLAQVVHGQVVVQAVVQDQQEPELEQEPEPEPAFWHLLFLAGACSF